MKDIFLDDDAPDEAIGRTFVDTEQTRAVFRRLDALMEVRRTTNHAWGVALLGPARCGKTSIFREYLTRCNEGNVQDRMENGATDVVRRPIRHLYLELEPQTRLMNIASQTLEAMGDPDPTFGDKGQQGNRVIENLESGLYDLVIFDEVHNLVDTDTLRVEQKAAQWLSRLLDVRACPIALIGYERFADILERNEFLEGRLLPMPRIVPHRWDDSGDMEEFAAVLSVLDSELSMPTLSGLGEISLARQICYAVGGRFGLLEKLLTHARQLARERRHSCLTRPVLRQAVEDCRAGWKSLRFNPIGAENFEEEARKTPSKEAERSSSRGRGRRK